MKFSLVAVIFLFAFAGCARIGSVSGERAKGEIPQQEYYNSTITFFQDDLLSGVLHAGRIRKFERSATILLDSGVVMDFYNQQGDHTTTLWADLARTDEGRKDMIAMGHVVARSDSGETLETTQLRWDNRSRKVRSDTRVKLMTPTDTINGMGFVSDEHLKNWTIDQVQGKTFREMQRRSHDSLAVAAPDSAVIAGPDSSAVLDTTQ